jgi:hypothetical protein
MIACLIWGAAGHAAERIRVVTNLDGHSAQIATISSSAQALRLAINMDAIAINTDTIWNGNYSILQLPEGNALAAGNLTEVGKPQVPTLSTFIGIPDNAGVTVSANYESFDLIDNIDVLPAQIPEPEGGYTEPVPFSLDATVYNQDAFYPENLVEAGTPVIMNDVRMFQAAIYPVQYNPVRHQLKIYRNISVDVSYEGQVENPMTSRRPYLSEAFYPLYKMMLGNFDSYMAQLNITTIKRGGIVVIVPNIGSFMWKEPIKRYADWKRAKGYDVQIVTTSDIIPTGKPTNIQIKTCLTNLYNNLETRPDFVMLVGDEDISYSGELLPDYPYSSYPSDHQYACLNGSDWLPDVGVARASVDNINELNTFISKVLIYEKDPDVSGDRTFWLKGVSISTDQHAISPVWTCIWVKERLLLHGFTRVDTFFQRSGYIPPVSAITAAISAGVGFVNYRGWAGSSGWYEPHYYTTDLSSCTNTNKPGVMTSIVCGTGNFGSSTDPCFGEVWIRMGTQTAPKGGPAFMGSTDGGTHTQWNNPITIGFYFGFLDGGAYNFAMAAIAGKMQQYRSYPRALSTIQQYFHTYNMLGDPELEMRMTTPKTLSVTYPAYIARGINYVPIHVTGGAENPIAGAYITFRMADTTGEKFYSMAKTDNQGTALIRVPTDTSGALLMTVSGRDLRPFFGSINVGDTNETIVYETKAIDDDQAGFSFGNNDGQANPTETIELSIQVRNRGTSALAQNVQARLVPLESDKAVVYSDRVSYGDIAAGQTVGSNDAFVIGIKPEALDGQSASFRLEVSSADNSQGWSSYLEVPIYAPKLIAGSVVVSGNGRLDPNETATLKVTVKNQGHLLAAGVTGNLTTTDPCIHISPMASSFGDIAIADSANNSSNQFSVSVDASAFKGKSVPFTLCLNSSNGAVCHTSFNLTVGTIAVTDPSGPDAYGYYVYDNRDTAYAERPTFSWSEIRPIGTNLNLADDASRVVRLPFNFTYYGERYEKITICSNGWFAMDSTQWADFRNWPFPDPSNCAAMIAPFWDDLVTSGVNANVYTYYDTTNHKYIIEWYQLTGNTYTATQTFQAILYDPVFYPTITGDGVIEFSYKKIKNGETDSEENYATIGWEDASQTIGFTISYSSQFAPGCQTISSTAVDSNKVYRITTNTGRGGISGLATSTGSDNRNILITTSCGHSAVTSLNGQYKLAGIPASAIDINYSKTGWFPVTATGMTINSNVYTQLADVTLQQCPIPTNLVASDTLRDHINLTWVAVNHADLAGYDIYRGRWQNGVYAKINSTPITNTNYDDYSIADTNLYWYYVVALFSGPDYQAQSIPSNKDFGAKWIQVGIESQTKLPTQFALAQNYPNPFNAHTLINYALPTSGRVTLEVFNILGQRIVTLIDSYQEAGYKSIVWNGNDAQGYQVSSGVYFYRLAAPDKSLTKQMLMLK